MLADDDPAFAAGRKTVIERLRKGVAVTPLAMCMPPAFEFLYAATTSKTFGTSETMRCPHYLAAEGGRCGVWKHRASICATWHCKYVRGRVGERFWQALHQLLFAVERGLSEWCVLELDVGGEALSHLFPPKPLGREQAPIDGLALDGKVDRKAYARIWGTWLGREEQLYRESARLVNDLRWSDVIALGGSEIKIHQRLVRDAYECLTATELPARLEVGPLRFIRTGRESVAVAAYSPLDPIELPRRLLELLHHFDGQSTSKSMASIERREGIRLSPSLVRKLTDFELLIEEN
jgi:hypothetical protein